MKKEVSLVVCYLYLICFPGFVFAARDTTSHEGVHHEESHYQAEGFDSKTFIFHHIMDDHQWFITRVGDKEIVLQLPIILYSKHSGFHVFMSGKLAHEKKHGNFQLPHHGEYSGKIIEYLGDGAVYKPFDLSVTKNLVAAWVSILLMLWVFISMANRYRKKPLAAPTGKQNFFEIMIIFVRDEIAKPTIGIHKYERFMPYLLTVFFFIWINNMMGLIPIFPAGANVTGNIAVTMALAIFTYMITTLKANKNYWTHIFNTPGVPWWLKLPLPIMPVIELLGTFIKPFTLLFRLFANITAGHIIVLSLYGIIFILGSQDPSTVKYSWVIAVPLTIFMTFLELLVALIQAFVFTMLSGLYFGMATEEAHH